MSDDEHLEHSGPESPDALPASSASSWWTARELVADPWTRRVFLQCMAGGTGMLMGQQLLAFPAAAAETPRAAGASDPEPMELRLRINGAEQKARIDPRVTLLDLLREQLALPGGCDHGQCGACTVLVNGRRINSCLSLALTHEGDDITTIEGLAESENLHPVQAAFIEHDGFQCGNCTPGTLEVCVERVREDFLPAVDAAHQARTRCDVATFFGEGKLGESQLCDPDEPLRGAFVQCLEPRPRLVILGSGPDADPLAAFAQVLGWEVEQTNRVCEIRGALDAFTAVVIGTHNYGRDFAALQMLMPAPVAYLGLIGSRRRREQLLSDLLDGEGEVPVSLHGPAGLDLGAEAPEEIALAIVAEIQATLGHGNTQPLCRRRGPIHTATPRPALQRALAAAG